MPSSKSFLQYVLEQLSALEDITYRAMMKEYIIYYRGTVSYTHLYRVYDFGRVGADGKPRELHIDKAIDVSNLTPLESDFKPCGEVKTYDGYQVAMMASCDYFTTYIYEVKSECLSLIHI